VKHDCMISAIYVTSADHNRISKPSLARDFVTAAAMKRVKGTSGTLIADNMLKEKEDEQSRAF
jgi:hypothetical protein